LMAANPVILDLNDARLGLWRGGEELLSSPGYALLEGRDYSFGETARGQARLHPRQINHRYWSQLDTEALHPAFGPCRHSADLVHAHLLAIFEEAGRPEQWILAASGSLQHDQLALLLGIIEQCPFSAVGLVDRAVAAATAAPVADYNWYVELQLHQALLTGMHFENGMLQRDTVVPIPGSGWLAIQDSLARAIADAFIRQTRFDPRHQAATEQALYDLIPGLLENLQSSGEQNLELGGRRARVERSILAESCENHYQRILRTAQGQTGNVTLGPTLATLPEIDQHISGANISTVNAVVDSVARHLETISGGEGGLHFITALPASNGAAAAVQAPEPVPEPEPTPPEPTPLSRCQIDIEGKQMTLRHVNGPPPSLNGATVEGTRELLAGDVVELGDGTRLRLVETGPDD
jgi:hypothetical protein